MTIEKTQWLYSAKKLVMTSVLVVGVFGLYGCSSGSGSDTPSGSDSVVTSGNNTGGSGSGVNYSGPSPATSDVQNFRTEFWGPMVAENRCTECHQQDGDGSGYFVRDDDINAAFAAAYDRVDLSVPGNSLLVQRVASGHGCWLSDPNACAEILETLITNWAVASGSTISEIALTPPQYYEPGSAKNFPPDSGEFEQYVWDALLRQGGSSSSTNPLSYCSQCHSEDSSPQQQPWFAHADPDIAYDNARDKINLDTPSASRFVTKLRGGHNCWTPSDCDANADEMEAAIAQFASGIDADEVPDEWNVSGASNLEDDGIAAVTGGRVQNNVIANYTFVAPQSASTTNNTPVGTVFDVSGVSPTANLRNINAGNGITWSGSRGVRITSGRLQTALGSEKFMDLIGLTGEYSIEAWVAPNNVVQDNSARIVTYSQNTDTANFLLGQTLYNYDFFNRSSVTDLATGGPAYSTPDADEVLQATLQHVVVTFDPISGRKIYVNGRDANPTADPTVDPDVGANIENWSSGFVLGVGAEAGGLRQWQGTMRLLAVHNRALTPADIENNFDVGVGAKFFMLFDLSNAESASGGLVSSAIPQAYIMFEVEVFDGKSYLFTNPTFISLDPDWTPSGDTLTIEGMRIGINAKLSQLGQAYSKMSFTINDANYSPAGQLLSRVGTLIPIDRGPQSRTNVPAGDVFFLTFDRIGVASDFDHDPQDPPPTNPPAVTSIPDLDPAADIGVRHFHKLNEAMSASTGISRSNSNVDATFDLVWKSLPANEAVQEFQAAHQMSIVQLGAEYCLELTSSNQGFFDDGVGAAFDFGVAADQAFDTAAERDDVIVPLLQSVVVQSSPALTTEADFTAAESELNALIDDMVSSCGGSCDSTDTQNTVMAACSAIMASAQLLVQ